ncbi:MAG: MATE family efflux transporter [Clostridia bacterium]|nr:MATE family efflux transporter [Clostridia bacterium]
MDEVEDDSQLSDEERQLLTGNIRKTVWKYGIPCALITIINTLYNIVDQIFIGNKIGSLGNAATNVIFPLTTIALAFGLLVGSGCAANYSIFLGKGDGKRASRCAGNSIILLFAEGIIFAIVSRLLLSRIVVWFGSTENTYDYAMEYGSIICYGIPCYMISIGLSNMLRADGRPKTATLSTVIGCVINCVLDPLFIFVFEIGMTGAALATVIGQAASFIFSAVMIFRLKSVKLEKYSFIPDIKLIGKIVLGGLTEFALNMCISILFVVNNNLLVKYGARSEYGSDIPLATYGIMMKLSHIVSALATGMGQGAQPLIGYCYGHKEYGRVKKAIRFAVIQGLAIGVSVWLICMIFAKQLLLLFGSGDNTYVKFGTKLIRTYLSLVFLNAIQLTTSNILMSVGKAYKGAILTITRNLILCTFSGLILCPIIGIEGVLLEGPIADGGSAILSVVLLIFETRSLNKKIAAEKQNAVSEVK